MIRKLVIDAAKCKLAAVHTGPLGLCGAIPMYPVSAIAAIFFMAVMPPVRAIGLPNPRRLFHQKVSKVEATAFNLSGGSRTATVSGKAGGASQFVHIGQPTQPSDSAPSKPFGLGKKTIPLSAAERYRLKRSPAKLLLVRGAIDWTSGDARGEVSTIPAVVRLHGVWHVVWLHVVWLRVTAKAYKMASPRRGQSASRDHRPRINISERRIGVRSGCRARGAWRRNLRGFLLPSCHSRMA